MSAKRLPSSWRNSRYVAEDALAAVAVEFEPLSAASDCRAAIAPGAPLAHLGAAHNRATEFTTSYGDVDGAFSAAAHSFHEELWQHRGCAHPLECRGALACWNGRDGSLTLWSSTQTPHLEKRALAELLELSPSRLRVIAPMSAAALDPRQYFTAKMP